MTRSPDILAYCGGAFKFKSSVLVKALRLFPANPLDVHHILSKNYANYPRDDLFGESLDMFGDGFTNIDGELWLLHKSTLRSLLKPTSFHRLLEHTSWNKVENGLLPVLEQVCKQKMEIDLQDMFQIFTFDNICMLLLDIDPQSMSLNFPNIQCEKALSEIEEAIFWRYQMPKVWKLQRLFQLGREKRLSIALKALDEFIYKGIARKQEEFGKLNSEEQEDDYRLSTALFRSYQDQSGSSDDPNKWFRDTLLNLLVAGQDTNSSASWMFYLLAKNPMVEDKMLEELNIQLNTKTRVNLKDLQEIDLGRLVYLHDALSEVLRLFSPVPFQSKTPLQPDILPQVSS